MRKLKFESGMRFGRWIIINSLGTRNGRSIYNCICDCGNTGIVVAYVLKSGQSKSCGCWSKDNTIIRETTHGMTKHPLYYCYKHIKSRCYNPNDSAYKNYGGRGIRMSDEWLNDFNNFHKDMHEGYQEGLTIERINVNGNYEKSNCIWIPKSKQSRNRTNTIWLDTPKGKMTVTEAAKEAGVSWFCIYNRYLKNCSPDKLLLPSHKVGRKL